MSRAILHVIRSLNPALGGPVEVVKQITRVHKEMGCQSEVATLDAPGAPWLKGFPGVVHPLGERATKTGGGYGFSKKFVPWLRENRTRFDGVVTHGLWQYHNVGTREALRGTDTPYFVFPHGMLDPWFKKAYPVKHLKKSLYWRLREYRVLRDARAVLFTCEEERRLASQTFRPYKCNERVVPLGIAQPSPDAARQRILFFEKFPRYLEKRIILFLGRLHDKKGPDMLIEAYSKIAEKAGPDMHLVIAGPPAGDAWHRRLLQLAEANCPPGSVSFIGMISGEIKWGAYRAAEAFVLPSHQENFGIAVVEALACGVPVLISDKVNIWREISADGAGFVQPDDPAGTLALLEKWCALDEADRTSMRVAALKCFINRFQIQNTARELLAVVTGSSQNTIPSDAPATA